MLSFRRAGVKKKNIFDVARCLCKFPGEAFRSTPVPAVVRIPCGRSSNRPPYARFFSQTRGCEVQSKEDVTGGVRGDAALQAGRAARLECAAWQAIYQELK